MAEMHRYCSDTPFILVGLKKDLRVDQSAQYVQPTDGARAAAVIGAKQYLETFAVTAERVFVTAEYEGGTGNERPVVFDVG